MGLFTRTAQVDAAAVSERLAGHSVFVIDVREPAEWRTGHIRGSLNLPLTQLAGLLARAPAAAKVTA